MKIVIVNTFTGSWLLILLVGVLAMAQFFIACGENKNNTNTMSTDDIITSSALTPGPFEVYITNNGFLPIEITIVSGSTVTWINKDDNWRAIGEAIPTGESIAMQPYGESGQIQPGDTYSQNFDLPGIWEYWCPKTMQAGKVIVVK